MPRTLDPTQARTRLGSILLACAAEEGGDMALDPPGGTLDDLAEAIGVGTGTVRGWIRGLSCPTGVALAKLSRYLNMSAGEILDLHAAAEHSRGRPELSRCH
jgi:hypothetical protein